jgi:hypothetical protein
MPVILERDRGIILSKSPDRLGVDGLFMQSGDVLGRVHKADLPDSVRNGRCGPDQVFA